MDTHAPHESKTVNIFKWMAFGCLAVLLLCVSIFLYWLYQPTDVLEIHNAPFPTRSIRPNAEPDGVIILTVDYCKKINAKGTLRMSFVSNSREIFLPIADEKQPPGCHNTQLPILLPKDIVPDTYRIKFHVIYNVNPIRNNVPIDFESKPFEVVP